STSIRRSTVGSRPRSPTSTTRTDRPRMRVRFDGEIAGVGTTQGTRIVVGRWLQSPFGPFADVMVERADGHRVLLAPARPIADFVAATYALDEVRVGQIELRTIPGGWQVSADDLELTVTVGARTTLG